MERSSHGLGLRAQVIVALTAAFALTFGLLGLIVVQVAQSSAELERVRRAEAIVSALARALSSADARPIEASTLASIVDGEHIVGARVSAPDATIVELGLLRGKPTASALLTNGDRLAIYYAARVETPHVPLGALLRLYLFLAGSLILLMTYVALTRLIVRPVEQLTAAAGRLAAGTSSVQVPVAGAAEVARLAVSFNRMAEELRREKQALEQKVRELVQAGAELKTAQEQVIRSEKLASVGRLAAGVAHEIGNPLAAISGLAELLEPGDLGADESREFLGRIRGETERIHRIIRALLDYSRTGPSRAGEEHPSGDVPTAVEDAVKLIAPQKDLRHINIERRLPSEGAQACISQDELTQILLNLLLNAADAVKGDGSILIEVSKGEDQVTVAVSDSGPGISDEIRPRLFEPFATSKPTGKGTGLGLAVVHALVERRQGDVRAENLPEGGARFVVSLPALQ